ncbi:MAG: metallophosphoesterase [Lachnospiraceae bacterium]|nr:metallophosphoesterase [Lachnospiraceae bacterium]
MSRILVVGDVHLKPWIFDMADRVDPALYDNIICLGDYVDDWGKENDQKLYRETLERLVSFAQDHPKALLCYGNHDISYLYMFMETGFSLHMMDTVQKGLERLKEVAGDRLAVIHRIDDTLFSHAGLGRYFVDVLIPLYSDEFVDPLDIDALIKTANDMVDKADGADLLWNDASPIWLRPQHGYNSLYKQDKYYQVIGHTPVEAPFERDNSLSLDTFSTWSDGKPFGDARLVIVDTEEHRWEYASGD